MHVSVDILLRPGFTDTEMIQQSTTDLDDRGYSVDAVKTVTNGSGDGYEAKMLYAINKDTGDVQELYYVNSDNDCYEISLSYTTETKENYREGMQLMLDTFKIIK